MSEHVCYTCESVSDGHPDKLADRISDRILDHCLQRDPNAKVACETLLTDGLVMLAGEFRLGRGEDELEPLRAASEALVRQVLRETGYHAGFPGIDPESCEVITRIHAQSEQIAQGVDRGQGVLGAGDQGVMIGYACDETPEWMPLPIRLAHRLMQRQQELRLQPEFAWLRPDAKSQVSVRYSNGVPAAVETVLVSTQLQGDITDAEAQDQIIRHLIEPVIPEPLRDPAWRCLVNPAGRFEIGGPRGDTGMTGRKNVVDSYGTHCPHGGGALSGKDPSKVDRSAAYAARWVAKHLVAVGAARRCTLQVAYAIGRPDPIALSIDTHGTGRIATPLLERAVRELFDWTPAGIIRDLELRRPLYFATAAFGHYGREEAGFPWEQTGRIDALRSALGLN